MVDTLSDGMPTIRGAMNPSDRKAYRIPVDLSTRIARVRATLEKQAGVAIPETAVVVRLLEVGLVAEEKRLRLK